MELKIEDLKEGMVVKVVFYHSWIHKSNYSHELGIVHSLDIKNNLITVEVFTDNFYSDSNIFNTNFLIDENHRYKVKNESPYGYEKFYRLESLGVRELETAQKHLAELYERENEKIRIKSSLEFLAELIKKKT